MSRNLSGNADWRFRQLGAPSSAWTAVRVRGRMVADNGEQAHDCALAGLGLVRRSIWDAMTELGDGRLVEVRQFIDLLVSRFASPLGD